LKKAGNGLGERGLKTTMEGKLPKLSCARGMGVVWGGGKNTHKENAIHSQVV